MMTGHQSFTLHEENGTWSAVSHNYVWMCGVGKTQEEAINNLGTQAAYYWDNHRAEAKKELKDRMKQGLQCRCGERLPGDAVAYHTGTQIRPLFGPKKVAPQVEDPATPRQGQGK